jgi:phage baseplate assembly protein W
MSTSILGTGLAFPVLPVDSKLPVASGEDKIRQSIWLILATAPGERVMLPAFGCGVYDLVFAPNTAAFRGSVAAEVTDALTRWEPRIDVIGVTVTAQDGQPEVMLIDIGYRIRATNSAYNLVYPLFLTEGVASGYGQGGGFNAT